MSDFDPRISGLDEAMKEIEKKIVAPKCHFTPMRYEACDFEEWWECRHCGHTKSIAIIVGEH